MNLQEQFYQWMTRVKANPKRASSGIEEAEVRVSEIDSNGVLVSKPLKKIEYISEPGARTSEPNGILQSTAQC